MQTGDTYNRGGYLAFLFSMIFSLLFFVYIVWLEPGVNLKEIPDEVKNAPGTPAAQKTVDISKNQKPWEPNEDMAAHGRGVYQTNCSACHGVNGDGKGPAGGSLVPPPRNFIEGKWTKGGDSITLFQTISAGISGTSMAPFGHLPVPDRWALVQYIHSITKNKVEDNASKLEAFAKTAK